MSYSLHFSTSEDYTLNISAVQITCFKSLLLHSHIESAQNKALCILLCLFIYSPQLERKIQKKSGKVHQNSTLD